MSRKIYKSVGIGLLLIPLGVLLLFLFGEVFSGEISGLSHLVQAVPLLLLLFLALKKPFIAGIALILIGITLAVLYPLRAPFNLSTIFIVEVLLFLPPIVSGILLIISSKKDKE